MLTATRALSLSWASAPELPRLPELEALYRNGVRFRQGQTVMIAGRPGAGKSAFALWLAVRWNLPTLYCSADMSSFDASTRIASMQQGMTTEQIEKAMAEEGPLRDEIVNGTSSLHLTFSHDSPITWTGLAHEIEAYVELWDSYPNLIVIDNLMDVEGCDTEHAMQMAAMQEFVALSRNTGSTVMILHHALENSLTEVSRPPSRGEIANKVTQKPEVVLTVAMNPHSLLFNVACVKQRGGRQDPSASTYAPLKSQPEYNRFMPYRLH